MPGDPLPANRLDGPHRAELGHQQELSYLCEAVPDHARKRFDIEIVTSATPEDLAAASMGTLQDGDLVYELDGETYRTPIKTLRGDYEHPDGQSANRLRRWEKFDIVPRPDDIFQERIYCIQWITKDTLDSFRPKFYFAALLRQTSSENTRLKRSSGRISQNGRTKGLAPDLQIEPGDKTDEPIRTRGWTWWHHLFHPRHLLIGSLFRKYMQVLKDPILSAGVAIGICPALDRMSKLTHWRVGFGGGGGVAPAADNAEQVFHNQALNTFYNYGNRSFLGLVGSFVGKYKGFSVREGGIIRSEAAKEIAVECDLHITDPPYADAICYHEITEYFIAWLRKNPPQPDWIWDSRRALAIKGSDEDFRREMVEAYRAMAGHMPDNGLQIVMFTHQDAGIWADMASIVWGAGLHVTAAWYIATETTSELKKGGYVQGTVLLVLRKRLTDESTYRDELVQEVRAEVARQIETMVGLNQTTRGHGRSENLFEDADLQMAGYAAAPDSSDRLYPDRWPGHDRRGPPAPPEGTKGGRGRDHRLRRPGGQRTPRARGAAARDLGAAFRRGAVLPQDGRTSRRPARRSWTTTRTSPRPSASPATPRSWPRSSPTRPGSRRPPT